MRCVQSAWSLACLTLFLAQAHVPAAADEKPAFDFDKQIAPILQAKCDRCHGAQQKKGELDLRSRQTMLRGGNGGAAIMPHKSAESLLIEMIESGEMPPKKESPRVTAAELGLLKAWVDAGAPGPANPAVDGLVSDKDRKFWSFVRPVRAALPQVRDRDRVRQPVDAFVLRSLEDSGLSLNPEAERRTLIRRVFFDLLGLPPTAEEIAVFLADEAPDAYERLVDRALASPRFGERWARHWLDAAGYADSNGRRGDEERTWAWRYRDYVIRAFNADKPYDEFLVQQLAGDELLDWRHAETLSPEMLENLIATGFLRTARDATDLEMVDQLDDRFITLHDTVEVTVNSLLGLTIGCAKCHSHKYDPIPQADYYRLSAFFTPAYNPQNWLPGNHRDEAVEEKLRYLRQATPAEIKADDSVNLPIDAAIAELKKPLEQLKQKYLLLLRTEAIARLPAPVQAAFARPAAERTPDEQKLVAEHERNLTFSDGQAMAHPDYIKAAKPLNDAIAAANSARPPRRPLIWALWDLDPQPVETHLLLRGDILTPGPVVQPGVLSVLDDPQHPFQVQPPSPGASSSGYRTQLARWIASAQNPLTARVLVNRVWQHHFGQGLVRTVHDFGTTGERPTHPELLDWLAVDFMEHNWSLKSLHRQIVLSATYRQSARFDSEKSAVDPDNRLLWRRTPLRLEAEIIRDALLSVSGQLNSEMFGKAIPVKKAADGQFIPAASGAAGQRRSIYLLAKRSEAVTFLTTFDAPLMELDCPDRFCSTVPQQALAMLNNAFVAEMADALARQIAAHAPSDAAGIVNWTFERITGRLPSDTERGLLIEFVEAELQREGVPDTKSHALFQLAHTLLNTNEFLYVD